LIFTANHHDAIYIRNERERRPFVIMHEPVTPAGQGLWLHVSDSGAMKWILRFSFDRRVSRGLSDEEAARGVAGHVRRTPILV
jgi:hypothetical protein